MNNKKRTHHAFSSLLFTAALTAFAPAAFALPTGGTVAAGTADIINAPGATTVNQSTMKAIINWNSFDTAEHVRGHPCHLRFEFLCFLARIEHEGGVYLPRPQLFAFPKGVSHCSSTPVFTSYRHARRANVSVERALRKFLRLRSG